MVIREMGMGVPTGSAYCWTKHGKRCSNNEVGWRPGAKAGWGQHSEAVCFRSRRHA
jgi:hypothetical protein